jgi:gas vesicle protein
MNKDTKRFAIGAAIAAGVGYLTGLLTAPKSGKETRKDVKDAAAKAKSETEKELKKLHSEVSTQIEKAKKVALDFKTEHKGDLDKVVAKAVAAKEKVRDVLSSLHDGGAEDKDLKAAVKEVNEAIDHLKKYLSKVAAK